MMWKRPSSLALAHDLTNGLMDLTARKIERGRQEREDRELVRRLTSLASVLESTLRADGNPERVAAALGVPISEAATSEAAD